MKWKSFFSDFLEFTYKNNLENCLQNREDVQKYLKLAMHFKSILKSRNRNFQLFGVRWYPRAFLGRCLESSSIFTVSWIPSLNFNHQINSSDLK